MKKYIALLRGINVSGKNKIAMSKLKTACETLGFTNVTTYINSGNILFNSTISVREELVDLIQRSIKENFGLEVPVMVLTAEELSTVFANAPEWWGTADKEVYHNTIFMIAPTTVEEVVEVIGEAKSEIEQIHLYENVIFWTANLKSFSKTRWSKIASSTVNSKVTIRNANTVKKLLELAKT
ncbi:DUF1697 domain-containing protein [Enterococcus wangshanyuanii]|uniref:DUF1697 domain-containing protein n=1 Tax=Enterococcus wangshanyuanii TaxID=2005703 RepID=A0ABQ1PDA5_9ENTE|nr:DUF1697 domain-containing protein [Enterococcus wangshanyuanii]GGC95011.1 hypothetical protein GCM10011573_25860 [Enterococcus wangshanyuanii]